MRACARSGGENICPGVPTRRAQSGSGPVPARLWCTGLSAPSPPGSRPLAHSQGPPPRKLFPGLGLKGAATSHEVSQSLSLSTHTTQRCGKKNLVQSLFSRCHSRIQESSGLFIGAGGHPPPPPPHPALRERHLVPEDTPSTSHLALTLSSPPFRGLPTSQTSSSGRTWNSFPPVLADGRRRGTQEERGMRRRR